MKGPSLEAIRRFKEQQELKKREDEERRIQEKLITLEHRASQGDKKAKQNLKRIEKIKSDPNKSASVVPQNTRQQTQEPSKNHQRAEQKPKKVVADFDELMKLARKNNNELRNNIELTIPPLPPPPPAQPQANPPTLSRKTHKEHRPCDLKPPQSCVKGDTTKQSRLPINKPNSTNSAVILNSRQQVRREPARETHRMRSNQLSRFARFRDHRVDDLEDDEYEQDDFVVKDDNDDVREELDLTLRTVFGYDRGVCDRREQELDREYRAIGHVSTFEDLEREERRASRLAAMEDAKAQREEDERKRIKRLKLRRGLR